MSLCRSFGYSKQAYYRSQRQGSREERECFLAGLVNELREDMPRLGGLMLWKLLNDNGVRVGRNELYGILRRRGLLVKRTKRRVETTDSRGWQRQHPNLEGGGPLRALYRAVCQVDDPGLKGLIHHSDRGCQYCSAKYVETLSDRGIRVSMTQDGSPYDNAIAEQVNGILKREWLDEVELSGLEEAREAVERVVGLYNTKRPHFSIGLHTPEAVFRKWVEGFARKMY